MFHFSGSFFLVVLMALVLGYLVAGLLGVLAVTLTLALFIH